MWWLGAERPSLLSKPVTTQLKQKCKGVTLKINTLLKIVICYLCMFVWMWEEATDTPGSRVTSGCNLPGNDAQNNQILWKSTCS